MIERQPPTESSNRFDSLCQGLEEYDALPPVPASVAEPHEEQPRGEPADEALDSQILAGLVSPL